MTHGVGAWSAWHAVIHCDKCVWAGDNYRRDPDRGHWLHDPPSRWWWLSPVTLRWFTGYFKIKWHMSLMSPGEVHTKQDSPGPLGAEILEACSHHSLLITHLSLVSPSTMTSSVTSLSLMTTLVFMTRVTFGASLPNSLILPTETKCREYRKSISPSIAQNTNGELQQQYNILCFRMHARMRYFRSNKIHPADELYTCWCSEDWCCYLRGPRLLLCLVSRPPGWWWCSWQGLSAETPPDQSLGARRHGQGSRPGPVQCSWRMSMCHDDLIINGHPESSSVIWNYSVISWEWIE